MATMVAAAGDSRGNTDGMAIVERLVDMHVVAVKERPDLAVVNVLVAAIAAAGLEAA